MSKHVNWSGVFPAVTTQFNADFSVNLEETHTVISNLVRDGVSGLVVCGSVGENTSLTIEEKMAVTEVAKDASGGRVPVICGIAEFTSAGAAKVAKAVERVGVDGIMVMPALVYSSKPHETAEHFRSVASGTDLPVMVYNNPPIYRNDVTPDILVSLADCENIVCFKDSSGDTRRFIDVRNQVGERFILFAGLDPVSIGGNRPYDNASVLNGQAGQDLHGYRRKEITQLQTTLTHFFDQVMGAERLTLVGEIGWTHVGGLESTSKARYGRDPVFGPGPLPGTISGLASCQALNVSTLGTAEANNVSRYCENDGYTTSDAWGYRARAIWDYNDVFMGVNLKPSVAWSHDVDGYSPGPGANFEEGRKAVSLGVDAEYQNTYTASLSYTNFFDGKYTTVDDRDFVALSFGMNF